MTRKTRLYRLWLRNTGTRLGTVLLICLALTNLHCQTSTVATNNPSPAATNSTTTTPDELVPLYGYEVVNTFPHDPDAYTQGLVYYEGKFLESTGRQGKSSLRNVELETGKVLKQVDVPTPYFAEGITLLNGKIYQLTWQHHIGFIYDAATFKKLREFSYEGEGWGLTNDGNSLILSDGTDRIRFLDPSTFKVQKTIAVLDKRVPVARLNELEFIRGEIYANVWTEDRIARIDAKTGQVTGWIQLAGLIPRTELHDEEAVLNGIAYDQAHDRLFVTGKLWPKVFEIRLK